MEARATNGGSEGIGDTNASGSHLELLLCHKILHAQDHTDGHPVRVPHPVGNMSDLCLYEQVCYFGKSA